MVILIVGPQLVTKYAVAWTNDRVEATPVLL